MSGILLVILSFCIPAFSASLEALGIEQKKVTVNGVVLDDTREPLIGGFGFSGKVLNKEQ